MILKRKPARVVRRTPPKTPRLSPRLVALVRESWWLLIVAAFTYLALILATYHKTDPAWSFSGTGEAISNKGGMIGAWLADLLLYLFLVGDTGVHPCSPCQRSARGAQALSFTGDAAQCARRGAR
ncbi:MAG: hypothetical protein E6H74_10025 [Betaproteobacteria bacterium]|nr:MAG: hypothetical protein E6H74_10025 [Betaproteobacteria bacterium]